MNSLLDHPLIGERYFFPRPGSFPDPFWVDCGDARLACSYSRHDPEAKTLVHFHGNGEIVDDWRGYFVSLVQRKGLNCLLAEYRGYGQSSGTPRLGKMLSDVVPTVQALGQPEERLIFFGRSVGSIFAIEAVHRFPRAAGLVLESGIADLLERLLLRIEPEELGVSIEALRAEVDRHVDHRRKLAAFPGPVLVLHALNDGLVDASHGRRLHEWAAGRKTLALFPQGDHNDVMPVNAKEYFELFGEFVGSLG